MAKKRSKELILAQNAARASGESVPQNIVDVARAVWPPMLGEYSDIKIKGPSFSVEDIGEGYCCVEVKNVSQETLSDIKDLMPGCCICEEDKSIYEDGIIPNKLYLKENIMGAINKVDTLKKHFS